MGWERGGSAGPGAVKEGVRGVPRSKSTGARAVERGRKRKVRGGESEAILKGKMFLAITFMSCYEMALSYLGKQQMFQS